VSEKRNVIEIRGLVSDPTAAELALVQLRLQIQALGNTVAGLSYLSSDGQAMIWESLEPEEVLVAQAAMLAAWGVSYFEMGSNPDVQAEREAMIEVIKSMK
jgi:hypothetical protein